MKKFKSVALRLFALSLCLLLAQFSSNLPKATADSPAIVITQIKVTTSGQFIVLYNNTDQDINMSTVALQYFNHYLLGSATSSKTIQLAGMMPAHGYYMVNDGPVTLCYQMSVTAASMGFSTRNGMLQVVQLTQQSGGNVLSETQDFVSWTSGSVAGVQTVPGEPAFLQRQTTNGLPLVGGSWQTVQPADDDPCSLVSFIAPKVPIKPSTGSLLLSASLPPVTIVSIAASEESSSGGIPASDIGLMAPVVNEILPNPASPQTDSADEYIEIYNPNDKTFDLSGFKIQTQSIGSSSKRTYTFPSGTKIESKKFAAYPSSNITVSLSNSGSKVSLLDPLGAVISQADAYTSAKDGMAWAMARGKWYWTNTPTPNAANVINGAGGNTGISQVSGGVGTVKGSSTAIGNTTNAGFGNDSSEPAPVHPSLLAGVGALAVLYGVYEYRRDIGNFVYRFKRYRANRGKAGKVA